MRLNVWDSHTTLRKLNQAESHHLPGHTTLRKLNQTEPHHLKKAKFLFKDGLHFGPRVLRLGSVLHPTSQCAGAKAERPVPCLRRRGPACPLAPTRHWPHHPRGTRAS